MQERLQKILARAGVASRRKAEELIQEGRVQVNGKVVSELGSRADASVDAIKVDGKRVRPETHHVYVLLNKPRNVMSTSKDPEERPTVMDYVTRIRERVYPVGRLDFASEGLILLTNDGEFTKKLTQAGVIPKVYHAKLGRKPTERDLDKIRRGIFLDGERLASSEIRLLKDGPSPWYEVTLHQGRNQQIRKMFLVTGYPVEKLRRVRIGFLEDKKLKPGDWRHLTPEEVALFQREFSKK